LSLYIFLYAGQDSANQLQRGFSKNLFIHIFILSKCPVVDEVLKIIFSSFSWKIIHVIQNVITHIIIIISKVFLYFLYKYFKFNIKISHVDKKTQSKLLLEYVKISSEINIKIIKYTYNSSFFFCICINK
jgi:hypothetical protein